MPQRLSHHLERLSARGFAKYGVILIQLAISAALLRFALRDMRVGESLRLAGSLPLWFLAASFAIFIGMQLLIVVRWQSVMLAAGHRTPYGLLLKSTLIGFLFNNIMPTMLGQDAARVYYAGQKGSYFSVGICVLFDKVLGLLVVASLAALPLLFPVGLSEGTRQAGYVGLGISLVLVLGLLLLRPVRALLSVLPFRNGSKRQRLTFKLIELADGFRVCLRPRVIFAGYFTGFLTLCAMAAIYVGYIDCVGGESPAFAPLLGACSLIVLLTNLPVSFNGIGVREQAHLFLLTALGLSREVALGLSILQYAFILATSCLGFVLWLPAKKHASPLPSPLDDH